MNDDSRVLWRRFDAWTRAAKSRMRNAIFHGFFLFGRKPGRQDLLGHRRVSMRICTTMWKMRIAMLLTFLTLATCPEAFGQQTPSKQESKTPDDLSNESFLALRDRRDDLTRQSEDAEKA